MFKNYAQKWEKHTKQVEHFLMHEKHKEMC